MSMVGTDGEPGASLTTLRPPLACRFRTMPTGGWRCTVLAALICEAAGCASPPKPPPLAEISGTVQAAPNVNPSVSLRPSPVLVRIYELKTATAFGNADFVSLYQNDQAVLGAEMVAREEFTLKPGDSRPLTKIAAPETRFLGVFAAYRDLDRAKWRAVVPILPGQKQRIVISAEELAIVLTATPIAPPAAGK